eukprot:267188-Amphidinium_carterae.1
MDYDHEASRLCPEFERVHIDTPRKWKASGYAVAVKRLGRPTLLWPFHLTRLSETVPELSERLVVSSHVVHKASLSTLKSMEVDAKPSEKWCKRFMRSAGYSYKKPKKDTLTYHNDYERVERIENLRLKMVWFQETYAISEQRTVNIGMVAAWQRERRDTGRPPAEHN